MSHYLLSLQYCFVYTYVRQKQHSLENKSEESRYRESGNIFTHSGMPGIEKMYQLCKFYITV